MRKNILLFILLVTAFLMATVPGYAVGNGYVNVDALNVRSQGIVNENSFVLGTLGYGESVAIISEEDGWYKIVYNEMAAFVKKEYITLEMTTDEKNYYLFQEEVYSPDYQAPPVYTPADQVLDIAATHLGTPYVYGGSFPGGFDCSGFTSYCFRQLGVSLYRTANDQQKNGVAVERSQLMPGDLVFFGKGNYATHVGIYVGNDTMIHSPSTGKFVEYTSIATDWYTSRYIGARRIF